MFFRSGQKLPCLCNIVIVQSWGSKRLSTNLIELQKIIPPVQSHQMPHFSIQQVNAIVKIPKPKNSTAPKWKIWNLISLEIRTFIFQNHARCNVTLSKCNKCCQETKDILPCEIKYVNHKIYIYNYRSKHKQQTCMGISPCSLK